VLLVNRGGPGGTGVAYASSTQRRLPDSLKKAYDVIGFDPRGVGLSAPVYCVDPAEFYKPPVRDTVPKNAIDLAINTGRAAQYAEGCLTKNGSNIRFFNSANTARDMDKIRVALGEKQINYLGYSYGTYLGATYATLFPKQSRRFILDSAVDPTGAWYRDNQDQNVAFEASFKEFTKWVAKYDATYHLGNAAAKVNKAWYAARAALKAKPADGVLGATEYENITVGSMYSDAAWPDLALAISKFVNNADPAGLLEQYGPTDLAGENSTAMYTTVECNDAPWPHDLNRWYRDAAKQYKNFPLLTWNNTWFNFACAFWPYSAKSVPKVGGKNIPNILVVNATGDAATPYPGARTMHRELRGSKLVTVNGNFNHGQFLYEQNPCTDGYGTAYLLTGKLPKNDVSCVGNPHPAPTAATAAARSAATAKAQDRPGRVR
jgi:pimeloyl-ACP methyl ester carboxylesterase